MAILDCYNHQHYIDWKPITAARTAHRIATRTANRLLVGAPLCRNEEYLQMSIRYTIDVFGGADKLRSWPDLLKPLVLRFVSQVNERQKIARKHLLPYIQERLQALDSADEKARKDRPLDSLQWCVDAAPSAKEQDPERLMFRLLHLNVAAVHTTSVTFLNCLYDLALHQEIHQELRTEIEEALETHGWTSRGLGRMRKLDSFMLESQRLAPIASCECASAIFNGTVFYADNMKSSPNDPSSCERLYLLGRYDCAERHVGLGTNACHVSG